MNRTMLISLIAVLAMTLFAFPALADESGYALLVQQSPPNGGTVNIGSGVHKVDVGQTVVLSATAKPGYRFLYWLGDVSTSSAVNTQVQVDSPKMVVAVFAPSEFEDEEQKGQGLQVQSLAGGGGAAAGGGLGRVINPLRTPSSVRGGSLYDPADIIYNIETGEQDDLSDQVPVPDETNEIPVPDGQEVPEPSTILLLGLGTVTFLKRRYK